MHTSQNIISFLLGFVSMHAHSWVPATNTHSAETRTHSNFVPNSMFNIKRSFYYCHKEIKYDTWSNYNCKLILRFDSNILRVSIPQDPAKGRPCQMEVHLCISSCKAQGHGNGNKRRIVAHTHKVSPGSLAAPTTVFTSLPWRYRQPAKKKQHKQ
jgi:hypothetical protein